MGLRLNEHKWEQAKMPCQWELSGVKCYVATFRFNTQHMAQDKHNVQLISKIKGSGPVIMNDDWTRGDDWAFGHD